MNAPFYCAPRRDRKKVERLQYGSGGHDEMPRGLMLEEFLLHNYRGGKHGNGNAKVRAQPLA